MAWHARGTARLRFGRISAPGAHSFVTFFTKDRVRALIQAGNAAALIEVLRSMHDTQDIEMMAATIMPDHIHLLFALGSNLQVGQVIGKMKALSCKRPNEGWRWQTESFEHQLRVGDSLEDYGFYIFMNPYRAGLCRLDKRWPWWVCPRSVNFQFLSHLERDFAVPEEWVGRSRGDRPAHCGARMIPRPVGERRPCKGRASKKKAHPAGCA